MSEKEKVSRLDQTILWDDLTIEKEMERFTKPLRDPFRWLKRWVRDELKRDFNELATRARKLGITMHETNWRRVLKGRWKTDAFGNDLPNPYISETNLLQFITALQNEMRVELLKGGIPFVETTTFEALQRKVDKIMRIDRVVHWAGTSGPTGTQKSASFGELERRDPNVRHIETSYNGSLPTFIKRLGVKCGIPKSISISESTQRLEEILDARGKKVRPCIIVDNTQRSSNARALEALRKNTIAILNFLMVLSDVTQCAVFLSFTPESENEVFHIDNVYMEQIEGRIGGRGNILQLANKPPIKDCLQIAKALTLRDAEKHANELHHIACQRGRIRFFFEILQEAKDEAALDGKPLTIEYVRNAFEETTPAESAKGDKS